MMIKDKLTELYGSLIAHKDLADISIKSFMRDSLLDDDQTSIVIIPLSPPKQSAFGSNTSLSKRFLYQVNVESKDRLECKKLQSIVEKIFEEHGLYQTDGGLEDYLEEIDRYVDARTYKGSSKLYENY